MWVGLVCRRAKSTNQAKAYPMKRLGVYYSPLDGMLVHCRVTPSIKFPGIQPWVERGSVSVKCLAQEHNAMLPVRAQTWTTWSRDERTNHVPTFWSMGIFRRNKSLITIKASNLSSLSCRISLLISCNCFAFSSTSSLSSFTWVLYSVCKKKRLRLISRNGNKIIFKLNYH